MAHYLPWRQVYLDDETLAWPSDNAKARLQPDSLAAVSGSYGALSRVLPRNCKIPYTSAAAAVATLSEPTRPRTGRDTSWSQADATLVHPLDPVVAVRTVAGLLRARASAIPVVR